jgi:hypothetical protein
MGGYLQRASVLLRPELSAGAARAWADGVLGAFMRQYPTLREGDAEGPLPTDWDHVTALIADKFANARSYMTVAELAADDAAQAQWHAEYDNAIANPNSGAPRPMSAQTEMLAALYQDSVGHNPQNMPAVSAALGPITMEINDLWHGYQRYLQVLSALQRGLTDQEVINTAFTGLNGGTQGLTIQDVANMRALAAQYGAL